MLAGIVVRLWLTRLFRVCWTSACCLRLSCFTRRCCCGGSVETSYFHNSFTVTSCLVSVTDVFRGSWWLVSTRQEIRSACKHLHFNFLTSTFRVQCHWQTSVQKWHTKFSMIVIILRSRMRSSFWASAVISCMKLRISYSWFLTAADNTERWSYTTTSKNDRNLQNDIFAVTVKRLSIIFIVNFALKSVFKTTVKLRG